MLGENIRNLRKQKGYSQETFAQQLNVVRQTVSKWEKGYSVPDAETLREIAELLETPVSVLLGSTIEETTAENASREDEIAKQLAIFNNQLAERTARRRKTIRTILIVIGAAILINIIIVFAGVSLFMVNPGEAHTEEVDTVDEGMLIEEYDVWENV